MVYHLNVKKFKRLDTFILAHSPGLKLNLALHFNLTTVWVVTPIEGAKILFKEMLSLI